MWEWQCTYLGAVSSWVWRPRSRSKTTRSLWWIFQARNTALRKLISTMKHTSGTSITDHTDLFEKLCGQIISSRQPPMEEEKLDWFMDSITEPIYEYTKQHWKHPRLLGTLTYPVMANLYKLTCFEKYPHFHVKAQSGINGTGLKTLINGYPGRVLWCSATVPCSTRFIFCAKWTDERDWIIIEGRSSHWWKAEDVSYPPMRRWPGKNGGQGISRSFFGRALFFCPLSICFFVFGLTFLALVG